MITDIEEFRRFARTLAGLGFVHAQEVLSSGRSGGLGLFWRDEARMRIRSSSARFIDAELEGDPGDPKWRLTSFYGHPTTSLRHVSWQSMRDLCDEDVLPWVIFGDFNEIIHADEKQDGKRRSETQMRGFREVVGYADLIDLGFVGSKFTWSNKYTKIRLDRAFATSSWSDIFPQTRVKVLPPSAFDHAPLVLQVSTYLPSCASTIFSSLPF